MLNQYQKTIFIATFLFFILIFLPGNAFTEELPESESREPETTQDETLPVLPQVTVTGERTTPLTGSTSIDQEMIEKLPARNGNVNDLLNIVPGVQFSEENNSSFNGGEIAPAEISISGGRTYENNYLIDGINNNNFTDPIADNPTDPNNIPGNSQSIFLDTSLVEQINVYDHNIPARFGGFTGGVVEAITKNPDSEFGGRIYYRRTSDDWTKFHLDEGDKDAFYNSDKASKQPKFTKQQTGVELSVPLSSKSGLLAAYSLNYSEIPLYNLTYTQNQERKSENYFLKYVYEPSTTHRLTLSTIYAPYSETHFISDTYNSEFTLEADNLAITTNYEIDGSSGTLNLDVIFQNNESYRKSPEQWRMWLSNIDGTPTSKDWGTLVGSKYSREGGFGDLERNQRMISLLADWVSVPINHGQTVQVFNLGFAVDRIEAEMIRPETAYAYSLPKQHLSTDIPCLPGDTTCIEGEQYLSKRKITPADQAEDLVFQYSAYIEDQFVYDRLMLRPGLRISWDTLMDNTNTAPRFASAFELSRRLGTTLIGGWNRYYSQNLLAFKLREAIAPFISENMPKDGDGNTYYEPFPSVPEAFNLPRNRFSKLKTPYSDEFNAGVSQRLLGGELSLDYVRRYNEDQLAKEYIPATADDSYHYILNNNGSGEYESYRMAWERQWPTQFLGINVTYDETRSTNVDYDDRLSEADLQEQVWYDGDLLYTDELPRDDFNRPWTANLTYSKTFKNRLAFTNVTRYQSHYRTIEDSRDDHPDDGLPLYINLTKPSSITFDWNISQGIPLNDGRLLSLNIDIFNVFNKKNHVGTEDNEYSLGRQFWAGIELIF